MIDLKSHFLGTYGKMLLQDWENLTHLIQQQTRRISETVQAHQPEKTFQKTILTDQQINDAWNGPFQQFYQLHVAAYAAILRVETALTLTKDELFKEQESVENNTFQVPQKILNKIELSDLKQMRATLNALFETHQQEWQTQIDVWTALLLKQLEENPTLSDLEIIALQAHEPVSELYERFVDLKIEFPDLSKLSFNIAQYLTLKATLAIQSALARLHMPNDSSHVHAVAKTLQDALKSIQKTEKELIQKQQAALDGLLIKIQS